MGPKISLILWKKKKKKKTKKHISVNKGAQVRLRIKLYFSLIYVTTDEGYSINWCTSA